MRIVYTFISDDYDIPEYTKYSVAAARKNNPDISIDFISNKRDNFFDTYNVTWIPQNDLSSGDLLQDFNDVCEFKRHGKPNTTYPSTKDFWHRTAERIFYLEEYIKLSDVKNVFHLENDVIMYYGINNVIPDTDKDKMSVIRMSHTHTTFAFCHIPSHKSINKLCVSFVEMLKYLGEPNLIKYGGYDHISEMSLLNLALRNKIVRSFPIFPENFNFIYDPGSYGQYFGGTNNGHQNGFIDPTHYIGSAISSGYIEPKLINNRPMIGDRKIFNLHIHSKNLKDFIYD